MYRVLTSWPLESGAWVQERYVEVGIHQASSVDGPPGPPVLTYAVYALDPRRKRVVAAAAASELMAAQAQAIEMLKIEAARDPAAREILQRYGGIVEGPLVRTGAFYDVVDQGGYSLISVLGEMFEEGHRVARVVITDPSAGYQE